ncbi:NAD(P)/FAD-dependent oxidoreductase [Ottowia sp.]|uniref:NAD(P)/FAD-dependent oxidoreductase n=1 Tax=Ottowia sp. TaxID=1898956 RepID=UPI0039375026
MSRHRPHPRPQASPSQRIAVIGAGIAGLACARTLMQAGHDVTLLEAAPQVGGRTASSDSPFGSFDGGAQYFTVRDARFGQALETAAPGVARRWSASAVRVRDEHGRQLEAAPPASEAHWVATPTMGALAQCWAEPLRAAARLRLSTRVLGLARAGRGGWQLRLQGPGNTPPVDSTFETVLFATPAPDVRELLSTSEQTSALAPSLQAVEMAPCWTLMLAFAQASQPGLYTLGPQWNAARSTHHRIAWLARESSKPQRGGIERWTVQASSAWSQEHAGDDPQRVAAKLQKAFAEVTGIRATPSHAQARLWPHARTVQALGRPFVWDAALGIGLCGDWCLGQRVEDAFVSGLELALTVLGEVER